MGAHRRTQQRIAGPPLQEKMVDEMSQYRCTIKAMRFSIKQHTEYVRRRTFTLGWVGWYRRATREAGIPRRAGPHASPPRPAGSVRPRVQRLGVVVQRGHPLATPSCLAVAACPRCDVSARWSPPACSNAGLEVLQLQMSQRTVRDHMTARDLANGTHATLQTLERP